MNKVRNVVMEWSIPDTIYSEYYKTLHGQIEYWLLWALLGQMNLHRFPLFWFGAYNAICLYLEHVFCSPFLAHPTYGYPLKVITSWDMRDVPEGQEHEVDENFIPVRLSR